MFRCVAVILVGFVFFKQKTAYEMRISDWSSDGCSSDLLRRTVMDERRFDALTRLFATVASRRRGAGILLAALAAPLSPAPDAGARRRNAKASSEERRVGKEGVRPCRTRWSPYH